MGTDYIWWLTASTHAPHDSIYLDRLRWAHWSPRTSALDQNWIFLESDWWKTPENGNVLKSISTQKKTSLKYLNHVLLKNWKNKEKDNPLTLGIWDSLQTEWVASIFRISQAKMVGFSLLHWMIPAMTSEVRSRGLLPPMAFGSRSPVL